MQIQTVAGTIREVDGTLRFDSPRPFGSLFMMVGSVFIALGLPIAALSDPPIGAVGVLLVGALWLASAWHFAGGRFGAFVVDPVQRELRRADGTVIAPLHEVRFSTVFDLTDGTNFWAGRNHWLTARCPGLTQTYRLGKLSKRDAERVLAKLEGWGCRVP